MITQKEALKNIIESIDDEVIRTHAIYEWLEDINWHTEARLLSETLTKYQSAMLDNLQTVDYILNPRNYCDEFINQFETENPTIRTDIRKQSNGLVFYKDYVFDRSKLSDFRTAKSFYRTFNLIFGWGINGDDWQCTHGDLLVAELLTMLKKINKENN